MKNPLIIAVSAIFFVGVAFAMSKESGPFSNLTIQLSCRVLQKTTPSLEGFEESFCGALAGYLEDDLDAGFHLVSGDEWIKDGRAVKVDVRLQSENGASVTIASGQVSNGAFTKESSVKMSLFSSDEPISPSSSRTLVNGVGLELGLIQ